MVAPARVVGILASPYSSLGTGLRASLAGRGWTTASWDGGADISRSQRTHGVVVVLEDDDGRPLPPVFPPTSAHPLIGIGSLRSSRQLAALAARGAVVLNQDVPFLSLVQRVEDALADPSASRQRTPAQVTAAVLARAAEAAALAALTERERAVLCGLVHGRTAHHIADDGSRAITTIRSQIQTLLRRLGATSQVTAVAIAHRSGAQAGMAGCLEAHHQF